MHIYTPLELPHTLNAQDVPSGDFVGAAHGQEAFSLDDAVPRLNAIGGLRQWDRKRAFSVLHFTPVDEYIRNCVLTDLKYR